MKPITHHHEMMPMGLNETIAIERDERDGENGGNASHTYKLYGKVNVPEGVETRLFAEIQFQHGPRHEPDSTPGITDAALLAVLIDRYEGFCSGPFNCRENSIIKTRLEEALLWMKARAHARSQRGVLGKLEA